MLVWIKKAKNYIVSKKLYFTVPIAGLTISNYVKDIKLDKLENEIEEKRNLVSEVMVNVTMSNYDIHDVPAPMGFKMYDNVTKRITGVVVNMAYRQKHGFGTSDYFGKSDINMDEVYGSQWYENDLKTLEGEEMKLNKFVEDSASGSGTWYKWWINKQGVDNPRYLRLYFIEL